MATAEDDHAITVSCTTEYPAYEADGNPSCWGLVTLKASHYEPEESKRASLDIVAVIDKSGSMKGEKLLLVKKSLEFLVQNLLAKDRLCVITYDTNVYVNFELLAMKSENKDYAKQKINEIESGTSTNLCAGLLQGLCAILDRKENKNDVASVLLFTDGLANQGITKKSKIIQAMRNPKRYLKDGEDFTNDNQAMPFQHYQTMVTQPMQCSNVEPIQSSNVAPMQCSNVAPTQCSNVAPMQSSNVAPMQSSNVAPMQYSNVAPQEQIQCQQSQLQQPIMQDSTTTAQQPGASSLSHGLNRIFNMFRSKPVAQPVSVIRVSRMRNDEEMEDEMEDEKVKVDINASVYTFGFGSDHDPDLLKAISDAANGMYFYIENDEQISESFGHCFGGLVSTLGQNIKLNLELCDGVAADTLHIDQNYTSKDGDLSKLQVNLGDMQSEEQRDVLLTLNLPPSVSSSNSNSILKASVTYFCVVDSTHKDSQAEMVVERLDKVEYSSEAANPAVDRQRNRILTTKAIKDALEMADEGELELARKRLNDEIKRVKESLTGKDEFCKLLVKDMERSLSGLRDRLSYESSGKKLQTNLLQMHSKQRSNRTTMNSYSNTSHMLYQAKFK